MWFFAAVAAAAALVVVLTCLRTYTHIRAFFPPINDICKQEESAGPSHGQIRSMTMLAIHASDVSLERHTT